MQTVWFDDGLLSTYTVAFPIMQERGIVGKVALVTGIVGEGFYSKNWNITRPCLNIKQLKELIAADWEIASHTVNHSFEFNTLSLEETRRELEDSKRWIEENLGVTPTKFVVPRHLIKPRQMKLAKEVYDYVRPLGNPVRGHIIFHWVEGPNWFRRRLNRGRAW